MNTRSIRFRLAVWYGGLLIAVFVLVGGLMYAGLKHYLEHSLGESQNRRALQISETLLAQIASTGDKYVADEIGARFAPEINDRFVRVSEGTNILYVSRNPKDGSFDASHVPAVRVGALKASWRKQEIPGDQELLIASIPYQTVQGRRFLVEVGQSLGPIQEVLRRLVLVLVTGLAAMVIVAIGGGYWLVRKALAPVVKTASSAEQITLHNLKERLPVARTGDELERLTVSLNLMIARLEDALQYNRRFIADASHEMRTPLTIMRGELEAIVDAAGSDSVLQARAASVLEEVERLARIVEGLFAISRLDAGEAQKEWVRFDLAKLVTATAEQMCLLAEDKEIKVACRADNEVPIEGDRARLKQVVVNLLDNAIKYTPPGGHVRLSAFSEGNKAVFEVEDDGIGIPEDARPHIFERFFRVDKARSREMGGAGLGLSIVKSICAAHGGHVDFNSTEGHGSRFKVELPLAPATNGKVENYHGN